MRLPPYGILPELSDIFNFISQHPLPVIAFISLLVLFIWNETKRSGKTIDSQQLVNMMNNQDALVLDIRDPGDYSEGHIPRAKNIPYTALQSRVRELDKFKEQPVVVACKMGQHSGMATGILRRAGFQNVAKLRGGLTEWRAQNMPVVK
ncbi:MAG: rhodanese-like domain-containing protein [Gammaproteobacteria bacterium]|nr:rhodanese-like domain-containing protein [Gammaproteobacteria bacterium]MXW07312.1 rhodanese-like domain-containing protein [Gammaproteobacteria bacterium]MYC25585.1 rhodanese-like domain-containing protein [Gammaproteobacteria bacterium]